MVHGLHERERDPMDAVLEWIGWSGRGGVGVFPHGLQGAGAERQLVGNLKRRMATTYRFEIYKTKFSDMRLSI